MLLSKLIASSDGITSTAAHGTPDLDIIGITEDSRKVQPGFLFIATPGVKQDGRAFIEEAITRGAVAVLMPTGSHESNRIPSPSRGGLGRGERSESASSSSNIAHAPKPDQTPDANPSVTPPSLPAFGLDAGKTSAGRFPSSASSPARGREPTVLTTHDIRAATSELAATFYPLQPETIVAITGTSGKTSTAQFVREIWQAMGRKSASIGTLGLVTEQGTSYGSLTTPDAITLHHLLDDCARQGITHAAMEASSHGIELKRLDHVKLQAGGFTNLSRDHLDYHVTMQDYLAAKLRLFSELLPVRAAAVLNADIPEYEALADAAKKRGLQLISYGKAGKDLRLIEALPTPTGQQLKLEVFGKAHEVLLPVIGSFQISNILCATGLVIGSGGNSDAALQAIGHVTGVPGRLQFIGASATGGHVFVDYAHKPDALENVLTAMSAHAKAHHTKLGVVFGCGGNRDKGKRPIMGEIAARLADWAIVTDDNPRNEDPATIRREVLAGCGGSPHISEIGDRGHAIAEGIGKLHTNDILIIAGKGHEPGQIVGDKVLPFDDGDEARKVLAQ